ncbi:MAG TPA: hypothetical protein VJ836_04410 [Candidatus Saccharimonadales bacterium]|nr:hypothetical protein [Candidatus Saccharimonadales bacterium]
MVVIVCGAILFGFAGVLVFDRTQGLSKATTHLPERFTELYFNDNRSLPKSIETGKTYTAGFIISNQETISQVYTYQVEIIDAAGARKLEPVTVRVAHGLSSYQPFTFSAEQAGEVRLVVRLLTHNQTIHFKAYAS